MSSKNWYPKLMYLLHVRPFTNILPFFPQNFASTKCVSRRRCSTDSTPTCTPLYLRIVAALMKRIAARVHLTDESWNAPCATLTCSTFHTNVPADQITRSGWCASPPFLQSPLSFFLSCNDDRCGNFVLCDAPQIHKPVKETHASPSHFQHPLYRL